MLAMQTICLSQKLNPDLSVNNYGKIALLF